METLKVYLKVAKLENKSQFERYEIREFPKLSTVSELKDYLLS
jgi:hypothetical protein